MRMISWKRCLMQSLAVMTALSVFTYNTAEAQVVPGSGYKINEVGDDFEDEDWSYIPNWPKASQNLDSQTRHNLGESANGRWYESAYRGQPDIIRRVPTPAGGLPGSKGSLLLRSKFTGIPEMVTHKQQQDDFLANVNGITGAISVANSPSFVVRVFLPPWNEWEQRTGATFGIRADCEGMVVKSEEKRGLFGITIREKRKQDAYWPGFFIQYNCKKDPKYDEDSAIVLIRSDDKGRDLFGPYITQTGWWTFGMSFTPDSRVHYYASPGVDALTQADYITSTKPYNAETQRLVTFFFNVVNMDDGRTWSTNWIVDDPEVFVLRRWW